MPKNERTIDNADRDSQAARLRAEGKTYEQVANALGFVDRSHARKAVQRALLATVQEAGDELRTLELERLNLLLDKAWQVMETVHFAHSQGRVVKLDDTPLIDSAPTLAAMDRILRIMERRAKLLGLDAPVKHTVLTIDAIDAEIQRLEQEQAHAAVVDGAAAAGEASSTS